MSEPLRLLPPIPDDEPDAAWQLLLGMFCCAMFWAAVVAGAVWLIA